MKTNPEVVLAAHRVGWIEGFSDSAKKVNVQKNQYIAAITSVDTPHRFCRALQIYLAARATEIASDLFLSISP
jgi:hypothetical protein